MKKPKRISILTDYITMGQFLKLADIVASGGMVKIYLAGHPVLVNGALDNRRGRKLYPGDTIVCEDEAYQIATA